MARQYYVWHCLIMAEQRILMYLRIFLRFSFQNKPTQLVANVVKIGSVTYIKILPEKSFCKDWICMNYSLQWWSLFFRGSITGQGSAFGHLSCSSRSGRGNKKCRTGERREQVLKGEKGKVKTKLQSSLVYFESSFSLC